ncbi:35786_t:CDS:2, partial [Racocetra persica]
ELKKGLTPNPDILCNSSIKFLTLVEYAERNFNADFLATGHYAKTVFDAAKKCFLSKPKDLNKDQTYFLYQVSPSILDKIIFPLANLTKPEVRRIAEELQLINAKKKDSTGICFVGKRNFNQFLTNYLSPNEGDIIDIDNGQIKGQHQGTHYFTIGQRHGVGLKGEKEPYYVVVEEKELINYYSSENITAKFRYRQTEVKVKILPTQESNKIKVQFKQAQRAITPGQHAVFYYQNICLGGGVISATEKLDGY